MKYVCTVCGYVYEGESLPADFVCPWNSNGFAMLHKKGKVSINCSKTYAWKIIFDKCVYNIGSWVVFA